MSEIRKLVLVALLLSFMAVTASQAEELSLQDFLSQVKSSHQAYKSAVATSDGASAKARQGELSTSFNLFADVQVGSDAKLPQVSFFNYDKILGQSYSLGIQKTTSFGLDAKLYYSALYTEFVNPVFPTITGLTFPSGNIAFFDTRPILELTQAVWGNGFGRGTRAGQELVASQALATGFQSRHQAKGILVAAEEVYWALALAREKVSVQKNALAQSQKIYEWAKSKASRNLGDESDALQARAALEVRQLEMQAALDEEAILSRAFNKMRNSSTSVVMEKLPEVEIEAFVSRPLPARTEKRDDVKAAEEQQKAARAAVTLAEQKLSPTLDLRAQFALNGRQQNLGDSLTDPFSANRPAYSVGLKFVLPLDREVVNEASQGLQKDQISATLLYEHKLSQQELEWSDLTQKVVEAKRRLELSQQITRAQKAKLDHERSRLKEGRTTTFQVLQFEQDFAAAQLYELRAEADVINGVTEMKLFEEAL